MKICRYCYLVLFLWVFSASPAWSAPTPYIPENVEFLIYVNDPLHIEQAVQEAGLLPSDDDYVDYLVEYVAEKYAVARVYQTFRELPETHPLKTMMAECLVVKSGDFSPVLILPLKPEYALYPKLLNKLNLGQTLQFVLEQTVLRKYVIDVHDGALLVSRDAEALKAYKAAAKAVTAPLLRKQLEQASDLVFYAHAKTVFHPFLDRVLLGAGETKTAAISLHIEEKSVSMLTTPIGRPDTMTSPERTGKFGAFIPKKSVAFFDSADNPFIFFHTIFGQDNTASLEQNFADVFEPQFSFAVLNISEDITPSFALIFKGKPPTSNESAARNGWQMMAQVLGYQGITQLFGESTWNIQHVAGLPVWKGEDTGLIYATLDDMLILTDSEAFLEDARLLSGKQMPSVWDEPAFAALSDKPTVFTMNLKKFAEIVRTSLFAKGISEPDYFSKNDLETYLRTLEQYGLLVGYRDTQADYTSYLLRLESKD
ncbi:hypothetical protein U14_00991 [Candidatus Moduliflexus flocculans]|uniref:DUF3352 domain-containing protein n=1 Tax=Candidatus Moduliflexus flocculans TaxID=1499966 RepID=A0A0S6VRG1_9BACT|nr:hypothetical protein U14_00991 [Candidatus Moduliflexus flocculans]